MLILGRPSSRLSVVVASSTTSLASQTSTSSLASLASTSSSHSKDSTYANVRPATKRLQVYRTPIPTSELILEDLNPQSTTISGSFNDSLSSSNPPTTTNGPVAKHGSFKSAFSASSGPCKNGFRVSFRNPSDGQSHTLFAPDEHSKKQWIAALRKVSSPPGTVNTTINETDSSSVMSFGTPNAKRLYAINGKVAKNSPRIGLFQKNGNQRSSPRIKASLSHTALESVRSGGAMKKMRSTASSKKLQLIQDQENRKKIVSMSAVNLQSTFQKMQDKQAGTPPPTPPPRGLKRDLSQGSLVAAAVGRRIVRQQLNSCQSKASPALKLSRSRLQPPPIPPKSNSVVRKLAGPRKRNKSWGHLQQVKGF